MLIIFYYIKNRTTNDDTGAQIYKICDENDEVNESSTLIGKKKETGENSDFGKIIEEAKFNIFLQFSKVTQKGKEAAGIKYINIYYFFNTKLIYYYI